MANRAATAKVTSFDLRKKFCTVVAVTGPLSCARAFLTDGGRDHRHDRNPSLNRSRRLSSSDAKQLFPPATTNIGRLRPGTMDYS
jgi:hypothetical protein